MSHAQNCPMCSVLWALIAEHTKDIPIMEPKSYNTDYYKQIVVLNDAMKGLVKDAVIKPSNREEA